jgi:hypothetical protein
VVCTVSCDARHLNLTRAEGVQITFLSVASAYLASGESVVLPDDDTGTKAPRVVFNANGLGTVDLAPGTYQAFPVHPSLGFSYPPFFITVPDVPEAALIDLMGLARSDGNNGATAGPHDFYATVAHMKAQPATAFTPGRFVETYGYFAPGDGGGAVYMIIPLAAYIGEPDGFGDHALSGGLVAKLQSAFFCPGQWGVGADGSGRTAAQNRTAMNAMLTRVNLSDRPTVCMDGRWTLNAPLTAITAPHTAIMANGTGHITRASPGFLFRTHDTETQASLGITPATEFVTCSNLFIDGGGFPQAAIVLLSDYSTIRNCRTHHSGGFAVRGLRSRTLFCDVWDVAGGGISAGKSTAGLCFGNSVLRSTGEGIQCDNGTHTLIAGNYVAECGGVGGFGANELDGVIWLGNHAVQNNHGGIVNGNKGDDISRNSLMIGNVLLNNGDRGIQIRSFYTTMPVAGITRSSPAVVTFPQVQITAIDGSVTPVRITAPGHGISNGDRRCITGTPNIAAFSTAHGPKPFKCQVIDADTIALWNESYFMEVPISGNGSWAAVPTSRISHPYRRTANPNFNREAITFSSVLGMTEINGQTAYVDNATDTTVQLFAAPSRTSTAGYDTSGYSSYTGGGIATFGSTGSRFGVIGNVIAFSPSAVVIEPTDPGPSRPHIVFGNMTPNAKLVFDSPRVAAMNRAVRAEYRRTNRSNVTGNNTDYTIPFVGVQAIYDEPGVVEDGVFTAPSSGVYQFTFGVRMDGMGASVTAAELALVHLEALPGTAVINRFAANLLPDGGSTSASTWRGTISVSVFMRSDERIIPRVRVNGLGADTADLIGDGGETYFHVNAVN